MTPFSITMSTLGLEPSTVRRTAGRHARRCVRAGAAVASRDRARLIRARCRRQERVASHSASGRRCGESRLPSWATQAHRPRSAWADLWRRRCIDVDDPQPSFADERHVKAVRRPDRSGVLAVAGGVFREDQRRGPAGRIRADRASTDSGLRGSGSRRGRARQRQPIDCRPTTSDDRARRAASAPRQRAFRDAAGPHAHEFNVRAIDEIRDLRRRRETRPAPNTCRCG